MPLVSKLDARMVDATGGDMPDSGSSQPVVFVQPMSINASIFSPQVSNWLARFTGGVGKSQKPAGRSSGVMPIGLDIGGDAVRMLQLHVGDGSTAPEVIAAARGSLRDGPDGEGPRGDWEQAGEVVRDLLSRSGFRGRRVVVALPRRMMRVKTVRLSAGTKVDMARQLAQEAETAFGVDVANDNVVTHFLPGEPLRRGEGREGLLAVARRADIDRFVGQLHMWGAEVAAVELEPLALYRNAHKFGRRERDRDEAIVSADIGARATRVIVGRAGTISFYKPLQIGGQTLHKAVAGALGLSLSEAELVCRRESATDAASVKANDPVARAIAGARRVVVEDLARELALCMRYYAVTFKGRPPQQVLLSGGAATEALRESLAAAVEPILPLRIQSRHPLADVTITAENEDTLTGSIDPKHDGEWATALGLGLREAPDNLPNARGASRSEQKRRDEELAAAEAAAMQSQDLTDEELSRVAHQFLEAKAA